MRGLQEVSARCGLLPKSYWIAHGSLGPLDRACSSAGSVSGICLRSMDGQSVAVKAVSLDRNDNYNNLKKVPLSVPSKSLPSMTFSVTEAVH